MRNWKCGFAVIAALLVSSCEESQFGDSESPIINGDACNAEELPQTAALLADLSVDFGDGATQIRTFLCTGTLIAPDVILTAAHCVDPRVFSGDFGTVSDLKYYISFQPDLVALTQMGVIPPLPADALPVRKVLKPEEFDLFSSPPDGLSNFSDIGLVFLEDAIEGIEPAIVITPQESETIAIGDTVQIAGWGRRTAESSDQIGLKQCATANIFDLGEFEMQVGRELTTSRKCHGDSGGPTYLTIETEHSRKDRVIGVTSRAYEAALDCQLGGIDTLPSAWYQWIGQRMKAECESRERVWCDVEGVVPPGFYDETEKEEELDEEESGGCGCNSSNNGTNSVVFVLLLLWVLMRRNGHVVTWR